MQLLQIQPTTIHLNFPDSLESSINFQNITLHQLAIKVVPTSYDNFRIDQPQFILESFQQRKITVRAKYHQESLLSNYLGHRLIVFVFDVDQEGDLWQKNGIDEDKLKKIQKTEIQLNCTANMVDYTVKQSKMKHQLVKIQRVVGKQELTNQEKHKLITHLEAYGNLKSLNKLPQGNFIAEYRQLDKGNFSEILQLELDGKVMIYSVSAMPLTETKTRKRKNSEEVEIKEATKQPQKIPIAQKNHVETVVPNSSTLSPPITHVSPLVEPTKLSPLSTQQQFIPKRTNNLRNQNITTTFLIDQPNKKTFINSKKRRKNKSLEQVRKPIDEDSEDEQQNQMFVDSRFVVVQPVVAITRRPTEIPKKPAEVPNIGDNQLKTLHLINCVNKPLSIHAYGNNYFILFRNALMVYDLESPLSAGRKVNIEHQATFDQGKRIFFKNSKKFMVFGCDYSFFVVEMAKLTIDWISVQRKQILDVAILPQVNVIAVGGINFSKFSMFGKSTSRSNLKLYRLAGRHDHLLTYDLQNAGTLTNLDILIADGKQLLTVVSVHQGSQTLFLLNVLSQTKIQIIGRFCMSQDLGLQKIDRLICLNNQHLFALQTLKLQKQIQIIKRFYVKLSGWKNSITTETCAIKQNVFTMLDGDDRQLAVYSPETQELTILDYQTKKSKTFQINKGFRKFKISGQHILLMFQNYVEIKKA